MIAVFLQIALAVLIYIGNITNFVSAVLIHATLTLAEALSHQTKYKSLMSTQRPSEHTATDSESSQTPILHHLLLKYQQQTSETLPNPVKLHPYPSDTT
jgi:hypothetical protein